MSVLYELRNLQHRYGSAVVLDIPQLRIAHGSTAALLGPNGAGKSTLLRLLAGIEKPSQGDILFNGEVLPTGPPGLEARRRVTLVQQHPYLFRASVFSNVAYGLRRRGVRGEDLERRVAEALALVQLDDVAARRAHTLSAGESQRVAIARALVVRPEVLLLDEPTAHGDRQSDEIVTQVINHSQTLGTSVLLTSHNLDLVTRLAQVQIVMLHGRVEKLEPHTPERG